MGKASEIWKEIKPKIGEMLVAVNDIETQAEKAQEEAFKNGYDAACKDIDIKSKINAAYRKGLEDAWECARKIVLSREDGGLFDYDTRKAWFGCGNYIALKKYSALEAIEKIRQYEQKQEEIQVGDEVKVFERKPFIVTGFGYGNDDAVYCHGFVTENGISISAKKDECVKTGKSFPEIAEVMRKMRKSQ